MNSLSLRLPPAATLAIAAALSVSMTLVALLVALAQPHVDLPEGATPLRLNGIEITQTDRIAEPDQLGSYTAIIAHRAKQDRLRAELDAPEVTVSYATAQGETRTETLPVTARSIADLPAAFWYQNLVGLISMLIGGWVLGLRPNDWGARMFALTTFFTPCFAVPASIYSTRQIALDGDLFYVLSSLNGTGALLFGIALVGLFMQYPKPLCRPRWILLPAAIFGVAIVLNLLNVGPDGLVALGTLAEMATALVLGIVQWIRTRGEPLNRAGLRWFILVSLIGCSLFIFLSVAPPALGLAKTGLVPQGYAFGFFNIMHVGLALGILRWRVFELDRWSFHLWLWFLSFVLIVVLDVVLLRALQGQPWMSLGLALIVVGVLYFPLRQLLLRAVLLRRRSSLQGRLPDIVGAALAPSASEHQHRWTALLTEVFQPLSPVRTLNAGPDHPRLLEKGLAMHIPGSGGLPAAELRFAQKGRRLFTPHDLEVARNLLQTHALAVDSRESYERGTLLERDRISRDIHDNIGAQLLSALHSPDAGRKDDLLRDSLNDLRAIINDGFQREYPLGSILVDLRLETVERVEAQGLHLTWRDHTDAADTGDAVSFEVVNGVRSILREAVSNVLRHAQASQVTVALTQSDSALRVVVEDDGVGPPADVAGGEGNGLPNIVERASQLAGHARIEARAQGGTRVSVTLPLVPAQQRERAAQ